MLDQELDKLEKEYLVKIARIMLMAQAHCEIKTDINYIFDELGLSEEKEEEYFEENKQHREIPEA